jgi:hypothetical protein
VAKRTRITGVVMWAIMAAGLGGLVYLAIKGWSYYHLPWRARFGTPLHRRLRSSGRVGHLYGWIGLGLILGNLLYLVRRRFAGVEWLGSMRNWMRWHVFSGLVGPGFVLLHSAFIMQTTPAIISAVSLGIVVVTGIFGRYLYRFLPRSESGLLRSSEELAGNVDRGLIELRALPGGLAAATLIEHRVEEVLGDTRLYLRSGLGAIIGMFRAQWRLRGLDGPAEDAALVGGAAAHDARIVGKRAAKIARMVLRADALETFGAAANAWRGIHRNLVVVMLIAASLHISVAFYLGYRWLG